MASIVQGSSLFSVYYESATLTVSPELWGSFLELAMLPEVDFNSEDFRSGLLGGCIRKGPPVLFPDIDLYLGTLDLFSAFSIMNGTLADEISPMSQLVASGLSIAGQHPTQQIWRLVRSTSHQQLKDLLDKLARDLGNDELLWLIFSESWKLRLLFYRQMAIPSLTLSEVLDEYRLFERGVPNLFRVTKIKLRKSTDRETFIDGCLASLKSDSVAPDGFLAFAERLVASSETTWMKRKVHEAAVSAAFDNEELPQPLDFEWDASFAKQKANLAAVWTRYLDFEEDELLKLLTRPNSASTTSNSSDSFDLFNLVEKTLSRMEIAVHKRVTATTYLRALDQVGDLRLDLYDAFANFVTRADNHDDDSQVHFWLAWTAESAARNRPLKTYCWNRVFRVLKDVATKQCDQFSDFMASLTGIAERNNEAAVFQKFLKSAPWWRIYDILPPPPPFYNNEEFNLPSLDLLQSDTSEFLSTVACAIQTTEEVARLFRARNAMFYAENVSQTDEIYQASLQILNASEFRVHACLQYLLESEKVQNNLSQLTPVFEALFVTVITINIFRGLATARLSRPQQELLDLFSEIDVISESFEPLLTDYKVIDLRASIWNMKIGLVLAALICADVRFFSPAIKNSWISTCLIRGDFTPRIITKMFLFQPIDESFRLALEVIAEDDFTQVPERLKEKLTLLASQAELGSRVFNGKHPIYVLLKWLHGIEESMLMQKPWTLPDDVPEEQIDLLQPFHLPTPDVFPTLGAPVQIALGELKENPFQIGNRRCLTNLGGQDLSSKSSSSSSSDAGSLSEAVKAVLHPSISSSPKPSIPSYTTPPTGLVSPTRRLSVEDVETLTRATRDGHEAHLPGLAPSIPPPINLADLKTSAFPSAVSPRTILNKTHVAMDEEDSEKPRVEPAKIIEPRTGKHYLQTHIPLTDDHGLVTVDLFKSGHLEPCTVWISNLEESVTSEMLAHELRANDCKGFVELRLANYKDGKSKGFAYAEFQNPQFAIDAVSKIGGKILKGFRLKASVSKTKYAVYEDKVLFVTCVPSEVGKGEIMRILTDFFKARQARRKRYALSERGSFSKRAHLEEEKTPAAVLPLNASCDFTQSSLDRDLAVIDVRLIYNNLESYGHKGYGYVEFNSFEAVHEILQIQQLDPNRFVSLGQSYMIF